ncbi:MULTISPECIES: electron transfer flavoprotein subunit alpha/FixB family protein [Shewanella]|jgi:electron transfer flavoprotein alpha subunit|uniref:Electron transfer flavoprotein subunit alpha n=1 Tax=Shewanella psychromarinicola TaxID=2487742 RepID=A0A3N4DBP0_9GAMM|nr:FAD-binding protein [Shewanella psychromarinicola]AZG35548.1 electron transfer flavoprotein subunit alpha/FixB family protein [Shewanella psychromarinicola]MCL1081426.1 FAD-binding protein [Shewanella psychromarinicola]RPA23323.1 electron transfer flavoprotein subunit alpha/FixB family protein [Shewanella psychromarinicola]|tara:strand:- start:33136 stop:34059 length:924 start_codon:yes stop_codon:yes gene_type:complete
MTILVLAEHDNISLKTDTAKVVSAAAAIGGDIHVLVAGVDCSAAVSAAQSLAGVSKVLVADAALYGAQLAENVSKLVVEIAADYEYILAAASSVGKDTLPRVAALLDVAQISEVIEVVSSDTFVRPIYAGNALATVQSLDAKKVMTVRSSAFDAAASTGSAEAINLSQAIDARTEFVSQSLTESVRPELGNAGIIVSGGRGMGNGENFALLEQLADKLGAAVGASRAAVDAGFVPNDLQVGQTGKIVAPDLYIAVGISGAIQHLAGMKDSKVIVAINKDPEAPIFQVADYGLVADLFEAVPALNNLV